MKAEITGIGCVTAAGVGCGRDLGGLAMPEKPLPEITSRSIFGSLHPYARRMDAYSKTGLAAIAYALQEAGLDQWTQKRDVGIIAATETGCLETDIHYVATVKSFQNFQPSPALFSCTLPNTYLGEAAIRFGLTGPTFVVSEPLALGISPVTLAMESLDVADADKMLAGFCSLALPAPFDILRKGPPGAIFLVLENFPARKASYGALRLKSEGRLEFKGIAVKTLTELVSLCLSD